MTYTPTAWVNGSVGSTPIDATNLNNMESGISNNDAAITTLKNSVVWPVTTKTSGTYTVNNSTDVVILSNGASTITLPSAVTVGAGRVFWVKNIHASASVTVNAAAGNVAGASSQTIAAGVGHPYISDGTNYQQLN